MNTKIRTLIQALNDEVNEVKGEKDAKPSDWWKLINWREPEMKTMYDSLSENTRTLIVDAGLCPECPEKDEPKSEEERAMSHYKIPPDEWKKLTSEERQKLIEKLPPRGSGGEDFPKAPNDAGGVMAGPEVSAPCTELLKKEHPDWSDEKIKEYCEQAEEIDAKKKKKEEEPKELEEKEKEPPESVEDPEDKKKKIIPKKTDALDPYKVLERANRLLK